MLQLNKGGIEQNTIIDYIDDYHNTSEDIKKENNFLRNKLEILNKKNENINHENKRLKNTIQEQSEELNNLKSVLSNFQSQLNGISPIKSDISKKILNNQKLNCKSKSLLTNITSTAKQNTSLFKFNDYLKNPFADLKKSIKKNNKSSQIVFIYLTIRSFQFLKKIVKN